MPEGGPELEDIVHGTDERPFSADLAHPAQQELAEAPPLLDRPKDRLHDGLPLRIERPTPLGPQCTTHPLSHRQARRRATAWRSRHGPSRELAIGGDERVTAHRGDGRDVRLAEIAGIQARGSGPLAGIHERLGQTRVGLLCIVRIIRHVSGHDDRGGSLG